MTEQDKDFQLEQLDQQIELPARYLDVKAGRLVEDLQRMYRAASQDSQANEESLRRVRRLLESRLRQSHQDPNIVPIAELRKHHERKTMMIENTGMPQTTRTRKKEAANERKSRWNRLTSLVSTLAAVLVVAVLIGSAIILFNGRANPQASHNTNQQGQTNTNTGSQPKLDCSHVFTDENGRNPDEGEHAVCTQNLETPLHETATINGHKITLIASYADANRLLVKYAVAGKNPTLPKGGIYMGTLTVQGGTQLSGTDGGGSYYDQKLRQTIYLESFDMQSAPANATKLQVNANFLMLTDDFGNGYSASLKFTVPVQTAKRIATPNAKGNINGHGITLTRVVVTPSQTRLYLKSDVVLQAYPHPKAGVLATINGGGKLDAITLTDAPGNGKFGSVTGWNVSAEKDLMESKANWTLGLQSQDLPLGVGSTEIKFTVPAVK